MANVQSNSIIIQCANKIQVVTANQNEILENILVKCKKVFKFKKPCIYNSCGEEVTETAQLKGLEGCVVCADKGKEKLKIEKDIVVLGEARVGKTCLIRRYMENFWDENTVSTIEESVNDSVVIDNSTVQLDILDTAGLEEFQQPLFDSWISGKDGCILVFDITNKKSLSQLKAKYERLNDIGEDKMPRVVIAGNKADLVDTRAVTPNEVEAFIAQHNWNGVKYFETSAKTGVGVRECFIELQRQMIWASVPANKSEKCVIS